MCNIPGPAQKKTQVLETQEEKTLDIFLSTSYKRRNSRRVQPQERQRRSLRQNPPPPLAAAFSTKPAASHPRSPSRRN
ncbi:hypothetical protein Bca52824_049216 [Brassica carinata]|uniref:Uncharacterized protein n=1 Tax=Brassica carinata TaxID=52824 RepID=A0A8X7RKC8_BRACI|nr:hypothetical protein Bca52824_049216 [Brassica carinata]